jgi:hypothetical protein
MTEQADPASAVRWSSASAAHRSGVIGMSVVSIGVGGARPDVCAGFPNLSRFAGEVNGTSSRSGEAAAPDRIPACD